MASGKSTEKRRDDPAAKAIRITLLGIVANVLLAAVKGISGVVGNSYALIADALESTMDVMKSIVVYGGLAIASVPPDADHPYGHGKAEPMAAVIVALGLVAGAVGLAIQSVRQILTPKQGPAAFTLFVLVGVVIVKEVLFRYMHRVGRKTHSRALETNAWDQRSDAITSTAAFIGILIAVGGGERFNAADDWAALFACAIIAYNGVRLIRPAVAELMDASPPPEIEEAVRRAALGVECVESLDTCTVRKMGLDFFVDLHVRVDGGLSVRRGHEVAHEVKNVIRLENRHIRDVLIHIEPS